MDVYIYASTQQNDDDGKSIYVYNIVYSNVEYDVVLRIRKLNAHIYFVGWYANKEQQTKTGGDMFSIAQRDVVVTG